MVCTVSEYYPDLYPLPLALLEMIILNRNLVKEVMIMLGLLFPISLMAMGSPCFELIFNRPVLKAAFSVTASIGASFTSSLTLFLPFDLTVTVSESPDQES